MSICVGVSVDLINCGLFSLCLYFLLPLSLSLSLLQHKHADITQKIIIGSLSSMRSRRFNYGHPKTRICYDRKIAGWLSSKRKYYRYRTNTPNVCMLPAFDFTSCWGRLLWLLAAGWCLLAGGDVFFNLWQAPIYHRNTTQIYMQSVLPPI